MDALNTHGIEPTQFGGSEKQLRGGERERTSRRKPAAAPGTVSPDVAAAADEEADQDVPAHALDDLA